MADDCLPWWHSKFDSVPAFTVSMSGCRVGSDGNVPCDPEALRADAEAQLRGAGYDVSLSLEAYTVARYLQSEVGTSGIEEAVAVAEAGVNRATRNGGSVLDVLLYRPGSGYGHYGPIHGIGTGTSTAPYGRWAATSQDPTLKALLIAQLVTSGDSGNFSQDADDQDGPEAWVYKGQDSLNNYVIGLARNGKYWVGPLPGVDHWKTFLQFTPGISASSSEGQALMQRGIDALQLPMVRPDWSGLSVCSEPLFKGGPLSRGEIVLISVVSIAALFGALKFDKWLGSAKAV
jgi:hypothetical protein